MQEELAGLMEDGAADNDQLRNLKPTLEPSVAKEIEGGLNDEKNSGENKFSTTFGFSHGVKNENGGILVRKTPNYKGGFSRQDAAKQEKK